MPHQRLSKAPLVYALAQIRFSPIKNMAQFVPPFQDQVRGSGYPKCRDSVIQTLKIQIGNQPETFETRQWQFTNKEDTAGYVLHENSLVFHTTAYTMFEEFIRQLVQGLNTLHQFANIILTERIGIRYINIIEPEAGKVMNDYLNSGLAGFSLLNSEAAERTYYTQFSAKVNQNNVVVKCLQPTDKSMLPPELRASEPLKFLRAEPSGKFTILDIDGYVQKSEDFSFEIINDNLHDLHNTVYAAFCEAVTPYAFKVWK